MQKKATISIVRSVRPSAWNDSAPTGRIYMKFRIWVFFPEICPEKFKFHLDLTRITDTLREDRYTFLIHVTEFFLEWEMFQKKSCTAILRCVIPVVCLNYKVG